jgi:hypothetical protein
MAKVKTKFIPAFTVLLMAIANSGYSQTVLGERSDIYNAMATSGTISISMNCYHDNDRVSIYYPPRTHAGSQSIFDDNKTTQFGSPWLINVTFPKLGQPATSTYVEIVINEGRTPAVVTWDYTGTITGTGQTPVPVNIDPLKLPPPPPNVPGIKGSTGVIVGRPRPRNQGGMKGFGGAGVVGFSGTQRGYTGRIINPGGSYPGSRVQRQPKGNTTITQLGPPGQIPKATIPQSVNFNTYLHGLPTRVTQRIYLRGGKAYFKLSAVYRGRY